MQQKPMKTMQQKPMKKKGISDIVFLLDVSGSMQPCIDALKNNIGEFIDYLTSPGPNAQAVVKDWRIKIAGYSDYAADGDDWWQEFPFSNNTDQVRKNLSALTTKWGGDEPESLLDALWKLSKMPESAEDAMPEPHKWRHRHNATRVVVVFTDATFHPEVSISEGKGAKSADVSREVMAAGIVLSIFCPEADCYHDLAMIDCCEINFIGDLKNAVENMKSFTADIENFKKTLDQIAKTINVASCSVAML